MKGNCTYYLIVQRGKERKEAVWLCQGGGERKTQKNVLRRAKDKGPRMWTQQGREGSSGGRGTLLDSGARGARQLPANGGGAQNIYVTGGRLGTCSRKDLKGSRTKQDQGRLVAEKRGRDAVVRTWTRTCDGKKVVKKEERGKRSSCEIRVLTRGRKSRKALTQEASTMISKPRRPLQWISLCLVNRQTENPLMERTHPRFAGTVKATVWCQRRPSHYRTTLEMSKGGKGATTKPKKQEKRIPEIQEKGQFNPKYRERRFPGERW